MRYLLLLLLLFGCSDEPDIPDAPIETATNDTLMFDRINQNLDELFISYKVDAPILGKNDQEFTFIRKNTNSKILYEEAKKYEITGGRFCLIGEKKICRDQDSASEPDSTMLLYAKVLDFMDMDFRNIEYRGLKNLETRLCHDFKLTVDPKKLGNLKLSDTAILQACFDAQTSVVLAATLSSQNKTNIVWVIDKMSTTVDSTIYDSGTLG